MTIKHCIITSITFCLLITGCHKQTASDNSASLNTQKPITCSASRTSPAANKKACSQGKKAIQRTPLEKTSVPIGFLEVSAVHPAGPAELTLGERLNIEVAYDLESLDRAVIWARPYINGRKSGNYRAHHLIPVDKKNGNPGIVNCWFYFDQSARIDEVRIFMEDSKTGNIVRQISYKVDARWAATEPNQ